MRDMADHMRSGFRLIVPGVVLCLLAGASLADGSIRKFQSGRARALSRHRRRLRGVPHAARQRHELAGGRVLETPFAI